MVFRLAERTQYIFGEISKEDMEEITNLFKESTYIDDPANQDGHPHENYDEMFASMVTAMRYHAIKLVKRIYSLRPRLVRMEEGELADVFNKRELAEQARDIMRIAEVRLAIKEVLDILESELRKIAVKNKKGDPDIFARTELAKIIPDVEYLERALNLAQAESDQRRLSDEWIKLLDS